MFTKNDRKMLDYIKNQYDSVNDCLKMKYDDLLNRAIKAEIENNSLRTKVDLYEKYIKTITNNTNTQNDVFMFDGEIYRLIEWNIKQEAGMPKIMSADFQCITEFKKKFEDK